MSPMQKFPMQKFVPCGNFPCKNFACGCSYSVPCKNFPCGCSYSYQIKPKAKTKIKKHHIFVPVFFFNSLTTRCLLGETVRDSEKRVA